MNKKAKLTEHSHELEEVPNAELHSLKGGAQNQDDQIYQPTGGTQSEDEQLLIYGSGYDEPVEEWDIESMGLEESSGDEWGVEALRSGEEGEGEEEEGEPGEELGVDEDGEPIVVIEPEQEEPEEESGRL